MTGELDTPTLGALTLLWQRGPYLLATWTLWTLVTSVYNLYFHPLAKFPGPKFAAASEWWQVWIEVITGQSLSLKLWELHAQYGDIVRIAPNELHFAKPSAYNDIYNVKNRWDRDMKLYHIFADGESTLTIPDYTRAKKRREITSPLFSRKSVIELQPRIQECMDATCENIDRHIKEGKSFDLLYACRSCAVDVIFDVCFAHKLGAASLPEFSSPILHAIDAAFPVIMVYKHFPLIKKVIETIPPAVMGFLQPNLQGIVHMRKLLMDQVKAVKASPHILRDYPHPTIYHEFLKDEENPPSVSQLRDEAILFVTAGTDTASDALTIGLVNIIARPHVEKKLLAELLTAWPNVEDVPRFEVFEKLPYLTAVIKESLRFSHGTVQPMTRVVPSTGAVISGEFIPGGTVVGMSHLFVHWNEDIFPDHGEFKPERWLSDDKELDSYLVAFSKGPRSCLGINLGWCELYMGFANLIRRYDMKLDGIKPTDWVWRDCYLPHYQGPDVLVKAQQRSV